MKRREWLKKSIQASYGYEGAHMTWPIVRLTRQIFSFDEPKGGAVWVGRGIPRHWLTSGGPVGASGQDRLRSGFHRRALFGARRFGLTIDRVGLPLDQEART